MSHRTIGQPVPAELRDALRLAVERHGEQNVLAELALSADTTARALAGFRVHAGTLAAIKLYLARA